MDGVAAPETRSATPANVNPRRPNINPKGRTSMFTDTGYLAMCYIAPIGIPDPSAEDRLRVEDQLSVTLKSASDEREYQFNLPITDKTPGLKQLEEWQAEGELVTILASTVRALPFIHDDSKDAEGNPLKRYQRPGRKVAVGANLIVEADAFIVFQGYDIRLAGNVDHAQEAQKAHGEFLKRQAEYRRRSIQGRIDKAKERIKTQQEAARTSQAAQASQASQETGETATNGRRR
jgi:hypothetical protein